MCFYFSSINNTGGTRVDAADLFQSIPLQRAGNKTEMAHCALFLASRTSSYVTGAILVADGGSWLTSANDVSMLLGIASSKSAKLWTGALKCISPDPGVLEEAQDKIHEWSCLLSVCLFPTLWHVLSHLCSFPFQVIGHQKRKETNECWQGEPTVVVSHPVALNCIQNILFCVICVDNLLNYSICAKKVGF